MNPSPRRSLFWTIAGLFFLTTVVGSLLQIFIATGVLRPLETREARSRAELAATSAAAEIAALPQPLTEPRVDTVLARTRERLGFRGGSIVYRGVDGLIATEPDRPPRISEGASGDSLDRDRRREGRPRGRLDTLAERPVIRNASVIGKVQVRRWTPRGFGYWEQRTAILFVPVAILASALAGLVIVRFLVRRLRSIEALASRVAEGDLTVRIRDTSGDEIGRLAEQLDRMTERIAEARASLEENERQRRQLFADITHELATPLTSIRGFAETLLDPKVGISSEERTKYTRGLLEEASRLDRLISDLFDLARLEAGASALHPERLDWAALAGHTVERYQKRFVDAGLGLEWTPPREAAWIEADGRRMEQVIENLLTNALRYVPRGGRVAVWVDPADSREPTRHVLRVEDNGPGIPVGETGQVFERFYRAESASRGDGKGSGLGLAIVKEIVERHNGTVRAEPIDPHGLRIIVALPPA